jgi:hypothetical protein
MEEMRAFLMILSAASMVGCAARRTAPPSGDEAAVRSVVEQYLHGLKFNDTTSLRKVFWPAAKLYFVGRDGSLGELTQPRWYSMFAGSAGKEEEGKLRVTNLEVTRDVASAKVVEDYPKSRYTDYLSLVKIKGRWWIVNKIYTSEQLVAR